MAWPTPTDKSCLVVRDFEVLITEKLSESIIAASVKVPPVSRPSILPIFISLLRLICVIQTYLFRQIYNLNHGEHNKLTIH